MKQISWWRTDFGDEEIAKIADAIHHEHLSMGPVTAEFERALGQKLGIPYVVATTSGSMAMLMALMAAGIKQGDEVIVPNRTWIATAHAPLLLGAKVVLVDVEADRPILDVTKIEEKITASTKAIMPVHLNGRAVAMDEVNRLAHKHGLKVIEDAAQAFGSRNKQGMLGKQSFAGCFSLSVAKIISTGQGGFVVSSDKITYEKLVLLRTHGVNDVINATYTQMGFNFRLTDVQAAIGVVQLGKVDKRIEHAKRIYYRYAKGLAGLSFIKFIPVDIAAGEVPIYIEVLCSDRNELMEYLSKNGIQTRPFYPDLDLAGYFMTKSDFPNSRPFGERGLFLPSGPAQPLENIDYVIEVLKKFK
jgi:dTDP-4-amino-4,6-dideoxygalactose transaminase